MGKLHKLQTRWKVSLGFVVLAGLVAIGAVPLRRRMAVHVAPQQVAKRRPRRRRR